MVTDPVDQELPFFLILIEPVSNAWNSGSDFEYEFKNSFHPFEETCILFDTFKESEKPFTSSLSIVSVIRFKHFLEKS